MTNLVYLASLGAQLGFSLTVGDIATTNVIRAEEMRSLTVVTNGSQVTATWKGHPLAGEDFVAVARLERQADALTWDFEYSGQSSALAVEAVRFPEVTLPRTDQTRILYPPALGPGRIYRPDWAQCAPGERVQESRLGVPSFQFTAILAEEAPSFYLDARDQTATFARQFVYENGLAPQTLRLAILHPVAPNAVTQRAWRVPFGGTMRTFRGDWFAATAIYRPWARQQRWYRQACGRDHAQLEKLGMWFWNRGEADKVTEVVERFQRLAGVPVALDWYWWHHNPYDMEYPNYWPPRDGVDKFAAACRQLADAGIFAQVYMNGQSWDIDDPSFAAEGGRAELKLNRDGSYRAIAFNIYSMHHLSYVCGEAPKFQAKIREQCRQLRAAGLKSVYLDEISCTAQGVCFNPAHHHELGDPADMVKGYRRYLQTVKAENPGMLLSSEEFSEAYMDIFDSLITLFGCYERFAGSGAPTIEEVPVVSALYHGAFAAFGSFAMVDGIPAWDPKWPAAGKWDREEFWPGKFPDQFAVEFGRSVVWGMQPTVHHFRLNCYEDPRYAPSVRLMVDTARFYHAHRDFLYHGEMLSPGKLKCATRPVEFMCRKTYAKKGEYSVVREPALPTVLHSVWRATDGSVGAVFYNWSREAQAYELDAPDCRASGTLPPRSWRVVRK